MLSASFLWWKTKVQMVLCLWAVQRLQHQWWLGSVCLLLWWIPSAPSLHYFCITNEKKKNNSKSMGQAWKMSAQEHLKQVLKMIDYGSNNVIAYLFFYYYLCTLRYINYFFLEHISTKKIYCRILQSNQAGIYELSTKCQLKQIHQL